MCEWKECKLGNAVTIDTGFAFKSKDYRETGQLKVIRGKNVTVGSMRWGSDTRYWDYSTNGLEKYLLQKEDIVIGMDGSKLGENRSQVKESDLPAILAQRVARLRAKPNIAEQNYVWQIIFSLPFQEYIKSIHTGTSIPHTSQSQIADYDIILPPLPEQRAIASVLSSLDDKIDLLHRQNQTLETMAETLFRQWFVEEAEEGWADGELGDYINVKHGYAFKGDFITTEKNNQILVTPGNFKIGGGFKIGKMKYFSGPDYPKAYIFSSDDLITTMTDLSQAGDTLGYSALIPEHNKDDVLYLHNQRVGKVEFKKDISKYFIYYLMRTDDYQWFILGGASGTSIRHTSPTSICSYPFKVPPTKRIEEFEEVISDLISKVHKNQIQIRTLTHLRDTLLPKLMSGEVRIQLSQGEAAA